LFLRLHEVVDGPRQDHGRRRGQDLGKPAGVARLGDHHVRHAMAAGDELADRVHRGLAGNFRQRDRQVVDAGARGRDGDARRRRHEDRDTPALFPRQRACDVERVRRRVNRRGDDIDGSLPILDVPERNGRAPWRCFVGRGVCIHDPMVADHTFRRTEESLKGC
jgi:hypothetical protein